MLTRPMDSADLADYMAMSHDFHHSSAVLSPATADAREATFQAAMNGSVEGRMLLVEGQIAGYALLVFSWSSDIGGQVLWLEELYLKPEARGRGWGRRCLELLLAEYRTRTRRFRLELTPSNVNAEELYAKLGFKMVSYKNMYLDNPR